MCGYLPQSHSYIWRQGFSLNMEFTVLSSLSSNLLWRPYPCFFCLATEGGSLCPGFFDGFWGSELLSSPCLAMFYPLSHFPAPSENSVDTERRATEKRWCLAEWSTKARYRGKKITPRKWFVTTALNYIFMFPKVEEIQVLHVPAKGSWPVGLSCVLPRMVMGAEWPAGILILGSTVQAGATSMLISTFFGILGLHVWLIFRISNRVGKAVGNHIQEVASRLSGSPGQGKAMLT